MTASEVFTLLSIELTVLVGALSVAGIVVKGWVKASSIDKLEGEVEKLWKEINRVNSLETKMEFIEEGIKEIKHLVQNLHEKGT